MKKILPLILFVIFSLNLFAEDDYFKNFSNIDSIVQTLKFQTGKISLKNGFAMINLPEGYRFLDPEQCDVVLTQLWGNPKSSDRSLGLIFPTNSYPLGDTMLAFQLFWEDIGYVEDKDAKEINYTDLLNEIRSGLKEENETRKSQGFPIVESVDWASSPYYDFNQKILHWAKNVKFEGDSDRTLNYNIRFLARKGVLNLNAIGDINDLNKVKSLMPEIMAMVEFTPGNKYSDFNPSIENVGAWTIGGLVAGKVLAKVGFFAFFAKFAKLIIIALIAGISGIWKYIRGKSKQDDSNGSAT